MAGGDRRGRTRRGGARSRVVQNLGQEIVAGSLAAGELIDHDELEQRFGLGRTGLREAMMVLTAKGMLDAKQGFGTYVTPRAQWNLLDADLLRWHNDVAADERFMQALAEVREVIEPEAARLAARKHTSEDADELEETYAQMTVPGLSYDDFIAADLRLHAALLRAAHNELLTNMVGAIEAGLKARSTMLRSSLMPNAERWQEASGWHRAVIQAVRERQPDVAAASMRALVERGCQDEVEALKRTSERAM